VNPALASYNEYMDGVLDGSIPASRFIHLACERAQRDRHRSQIGDVAFPYYFDSKAADRVITFCQLLFPSEGEWAGKPLKLLPWQKFVIGELFGWKRRDSGFRRYRFVYIEVPRKNGKTTLLAAIGLYMLTSDDEPGAEVFSAACSRDQAHEIWDEAAAMATASLQRYVKVSKFELTCPKNPRSKFLALAAEGKTLDGHNVHCALIDELHEHPDRTVYVKLKTGTGSRRQPMIIAITTAGGTGTETFCYQQRTIVARILTLDSENDAYFGFIACIDDPAKWEDEAEWYKCNPSLGVSKNISVVRDEYLLARDNPDELNDFLRYHLNIWTAAERVWMPMNKWNAPCCTGTDEEFPDLMKLRTALEEKLKGRIAVAAVDLAATIDLQALVLAFPPQTEGEPWYCLPYFWVPEDTMRERVQRDHVHYDVWAREGFLYTTPGGACDSKPLTAKLTELAKLYDIREVEFDRWGAQDFINDAQGEGFVVVNFGQGFQSMSPPTKELLKLVINGKIVHAANPILRWMASNVVVSTDPTSAIKPAKDKSSEKIDGIVALIMGIAGGERHKMLGSPEIWSM
jgi:phage terminase large subunit-like protein